MTTYYRFDRFELRPARRQLLEDGMEIDVGGRAFDLLVALVERRDRVVTRDELYALVWPSVSVELNNLHVQIWRLRSRLGDHAIRTIARQGYQFVAEIDAVVQPPSSTRVPAWFEPLQRDAFRDADGDGGSGDALPRPASLGERLDGALKRHRVVTFIDDDDARRRRLLDDALAGLPPARRRGTLHYDTADLMRRAARADDAAPAEAGGLPQLVRAASRALLREQLLVLQDAHLAPELVATLVATVLRDSARMRVVLSACTPLGLQDEHALRVGAEPTPAAPGPTPDGRGPGALPDAVDDAPARALRWRSRGTPA